MTPQPIHTDLKLYGVHEPDSSIEDDGSGGKKVVGLPGFYTIGTYIEGVWVPILRRKAAGLFADIARAANAPSGDTTPTE